MSVWRIVLGVGALVLGVGALMLAHDIRSWHGGVDQGDARFASGPAAARLSATEASASLSSVAERIPRRLPARDA